MTATPPDPLATQHDGTTDPDNQAPVDMQTLRLREENRALRELLAAQVQAALPQQRPGWLRRLGWWLISAPGAALVGWRSLLGRDEATPITRRSVGNATLTVLYTLAIYGALVLLVVSWSSPNPARTGATAAGPVRVPLLPPAPELDPAPQGPASPPEMPDAAEPGPAASAAQAGSEPPSQPTSHPAPQSMPIAAPAMVPGPPASETPVPTDAPRPTLRVTEIPMQNPLAWVDALKGELARCADLGFFERPDCAWTARKQFCEPNHGWGAVKECPTQP
ncbi:hypothetical protein ACFWP0_16230 [Achromobacter sp. NPDC058515]|uniref:hypothetical protein n=1 Tax=Achromobacter sp. NPDC058515 TaxID=3346533 RepID=UPI00366A22AD